MTKRTDLKEAAEKFRARKVRKRRGERRGNKGKISQESSRRNVVIEMKKERRKEDLDRQREIRMEEKRFVGK